MPVFLSNLIVVVALCVAHGCLANETSRRS